MWKLVEGAYPFSSQRQSRCLQGQRSLLERSDLGYLRLHQREELWASSLARAENLQRNAGRMIAVGMGGSSLGAKAFLQATSGLKGHERDVLFCDNVDPIAFERKFGPYRGSEDTHWVLVSKSGSTVETLATASLLMESFSLTELQNQITVITELRDNPLRTWAESKKITCLEIPVDVGGRFSVFSPVGLLPLAYAGQKLEEVKRGLQRAADQMDKLALPLADQYLASFADEKWINAFWAYTDDLTELGLWFQQLWAESLAKANKRNGEKAERVSTPLSLRGPADQHSVLQQIMEGERDKLVNFVRVKSVEDFGLDLQSSYFSGQDFLAGINMGGLLSAEAQATESSLREAGVPCLRIEGAELSASSVAFLMQTLMISVGILGEVLDINAFDQPGVEAGKIITKKLLSDR